MITAYHWCAKTAILEKKNRELRKSMREMLDCYWGSGDGEKPPEFIKRAAKLSGWKLPPLYRSAVEIGTEMHKAIDAVMEPIVKERDALKALLRRAVDILKNGLRIAGNLPLRLKTDSRFSTFLRHGERLVNEAEEHLK